MPQKQRVMRVTQSPYSAGFGGVDWDQDGYMNTVIWVLDLACGHEQYVTQKVRPKMYSLKRVPGDVLESPRYVECSTCKAAAASPLPEAPEQ